MADTLQYNMPLFKCLSVLSHSHNPLRRKEDSLSSPLAAFWILFFPVFFAPPPPPPPPPPPKRPSLESAFVPQAPWTRGATTARSLPLRNSVPVPLDVGLLLLLGALVSAPPALALRCPLISLSSFCFSVQCCFSVRLSLIFFCFVLFFVFSPSLTLALCR
jgi:hypothetical protein